jgi:hypothetical protein
MTVTGRDGKDSCDEAEKGDKKPHTIKNMLDSFRMENSLF